MKNRLLSISVSVSLLLLAVPAFVSAQGFIPQCALDCGTCNMCDMIGMFVSLSTLITQWASGVILFTLVLGGFFMLISAGSSERVEKGKQIIIGSVIGLVLILTGYIIVNFSIGAFLGAPNAKLFGSVEWQKYCEPSKNTCGTAPAATTPSLCNPNYKNVSCAVSADLCKQQGGTVIPGQSGVCSTSQVCCTTDTAATYCDASGTNVVCLSTEAQCAGFSGKIVSGKCTDPAKTVCCKIASK